MLSAALLLTLVSHAAAVSVAPSQTLEALKAQAVPATDARGEDAAARAGQGFEGSPFHIKSLTPVEFVATDPVRRTETPIGEEPAPQRESSLAPDAEAAPAEGVPQRSPTNNYYFEGKSPLSGITI